MRVRAAVSATMPREAALRDVAAGVAAPLLVSYAAWILRDAERRGIRRIYFLARDGQVLLEIARILARRLGVSIECRYLYASRQAWLRNVTDLQATDAGHWLWWGVWQGFVPGESTLNNLKRRLGVPGSDLDAALDAHGFGLVTHDLPLSDDNVERLKAFFATEGFAAALARSRADNRKFLKNYLAQEGLFDGTPSAMVDIGWAGNLHAALARAQAAEGVAPAHGYYFGYNEKRLAEWREDCSRFQYDLEDEAEPEFKPAFKQELVEIYSEIFCTADHGTLTGFREEAGRVVPEIAPGWDTRMQEWGLPVVRRTLAAVAEGLNVAELDLDGTLSMRGPIRDLLEAFWMHPTAAEARAWGAFPIEIGEGHGSRATALAEPYRAGDLLPLVTGRARMRKHLYFWTEGALAMTPAPLAGTLRALRAVRGRDRTGARSKV